MPPLLKTIYTQMIRHAQREAPYECCGLLAGTESQMTVLYPIQNLSSDDPRIADLNIPADRRLRYMMDPKEQFDAMKDMRAKGLTMMGIYHSHPHSPAYPSETDVRLAFYADLFYLIVTLKASELPIRAFRIVAGVIAEEALETI